MGLAVYFFSGTGNTYILANQIAEKFETAPISIPNIMHGEKIHVDTGDMCIVFPCYMATLSGLPLIVERFVRKIDNLGEVTLFAVCNCGGYEIVNALPSLHRLRQIVESCNGKLYAGHSLRLPMNNLDYDHIPIPINRNSEDIIRKAKIQTDRISAMIRQRRRTRFAIPKNLFSLVMKPMYGMINNAVMRELRIRAHEPDDSRLHYDELIPLTDKSIVVDGTCTGCGICAKLCPVDNIKLVDRKPEFQHACEMCFACDEWCPTGSIHHWSRARGVKYHHPEAIPRNFFYR
ncbi:MAG: EFR1 family ferrodoxin [Sphaerochaeta sp.]|jgi:ferredoxin/flavodoxin|nr:EFR1 family ferrodoxin [Sphaerochaeta sp.]PKL29192.1 MAG: hypothetical protein CVV46_02535 [Spirochaetae bacterium HGW-Spirochaetae-2]